MPDVYQGTELWEDSLVDPDNRRAGGLRPAPALLAGLPGPDGPPPVDGTGAAKLWLVSRALRLRAGRPELFATYRPLVAVGPAADCAVAFDRGGAVTVATRLPVGLGRRGGWADTSLELPPGEYRDVLSGRRASGVVALADLLRDYPVALLAREVGA